MLIRYKRTFEKIAMGLLSFMPEEKDLKKLQETIQLYESDENWQLYLWKKDDDFIGLIGVETSENNCIVHHVSVNPSHRGEGIGREMVGKLSLLMPDKTICASDITQPFIEKCTISKEGTDQ
jgi:riboflavin biosynthesis RibT protein